MPESVSAGRVFFFIVPVLMQSPAFGQQTARLTSEKAADLPDAPHAAQASNQSGAIGTRQVDAGSISGTVLDKNGESLQGAKVTLTGTVGGPPRFVDSGNDGQFTFTDLGPDVYQLTVTAPGMTAFISPQIPLRAGEFHLQSRVTLSIASVATSITVNGNEEQLSEEQLHIAEHRRVVGVIPNFYSTYDWNAPPMLRSRNSN